MPTTRVTPTQASFVALTAVTGHALPPAAARALLRHGQPGWARVAAANPRQVPDTIAEFAVGKDLRVRAEALAQTPDVDTLTRFAAARGRTFRAAVAANVHTPQDTLTELLGTEPFAHLPAVMNPATPHTEVVNALLRVPPHRLIAPHRAQGGTLRFAVSRVILSHHPSAVGVFATSPDHAVRKAVLAMPRPDGDAVKTVLVSAHRSLHAVAAGNLAIDRSLLRAGARTLRDEVQDAVAALEAGTGNALMRAATVGSALLDSELVTSPHTLDAQVVEALTSRKHPVDTLIDGSVIAALVERYGLPAYECFGGMSTLRAEAASLCSRLMRALAMVQPAPLSKPRGPSQQTAASAADLAAGFAANDGARQVIATLGDREAAWMTFLLSLDAADDAGLSAVEVANAAAAAAA